jgi:16S rRNA (cytosine1402-N4)-methyltransferase
MNIYHKSVFLREAIDSLEVKPGKKYIDATLGGGGHTFSILEQGGEVLGLDVDQDALDYVEEEFKIQNLKFKVDKENFIAKKGNFRRIDEIARENGYESVSGILFDLGVSSHQFDSAERGFSFTKNASLDMRMDKDLGVTAKDLLVVLSKADLMKLFSEYGEERFSGRIADAIVKRRETKAIETTEELEALIRMVVPKKIEAIHPGTRVFQALRIAVNSELDNLSEALQRTIGLLEKNGRIVVISFHSLEDRIVKRTFVDWREKQIGKIITEKPIVPSESEISQNSRSRSAKMRVFEKI